jgi:hypothetical protein
MKWFNEHKGMMVSRLQSEDVVPMQAIDFSPLTGVFHDISPHFSAIGVWFLAGYEKNRVYLKKAEPAPSEEEGMVRDSSPRLLPVQWAGGVGIRTLLHDPPPPGYGATIKHNKTRWWRIIFFWVGCV